MENTTLSPRRKIKQRRSQMLVHSFIYYVLDDSLVSDDTWQKWANDLVELQKEYPRPIKFYDDEFKDWDGSTGCHLPIDHWVQKVANRLVYYRDNPTTKLKKRKRLKRKKKNV